MNPEAISRLAVELGWEDGQLMRFHRTFILEHGDQADEKCRKWLEDTWAEIQPHTYLLAAQGSAYVTDPDHPTPDGDGRHYGYTETPYNAMRDEGESPPPHELASYRMSREARDRYQGERMGEVDELMGALATLRASLNAMPAKNKTRAIWALKGRMDVVEREIRRRAAA